MALSTRCDKLITVANASGLCEDYIEVLDVGYAKGNFIRPQKLVGWFVNEVFHVEWNPNRNTENFFTLSCLGSSHCAGSTLVFKLADQSQDLEIACRYWPAHGNVWHSTWCKNPQYNHLIGIGATKQAVLYDFEKETSLRKLKSSSDFHCVEFAHQSPVIFLGSRNGGIVCADFRMRIRDESRLSDCTTRQRSSITCMKIMRDENYLMASTMDGMIKMWDIRLSKPVKEYCGNVNETKLIPFSIDSSESILVSAGGDGRTRIWSVSSCELLNVIEGYPGIDHENSVVPSVCLGEMWANTAGFMALGVGIRDQLLVYY